jgi:hypothetical protein
MPRFSRSETHAPYWFITFLITYVLSAWPLSAASEGCGDRLVNRSVLIAMATAGDARALRLEYRRATNPDPTTRLFFASRLLTLEPNGVAERRLVDAIPTRSTDLEVLYGFTYPDCSVPAVLSAFGGGAWISQAREAVIHQRKGVRAFLMLVWLYRMNADIGEMLPEEVQAVEHALPTEFRRAFKSLPHHVQELIEGGRELLPATS